MYKLLLSVLVCFVFFGCGPDLSKFDYLKEPQIKTMPKQKMLVFELKGDPDKAGKKAFGTLFKTIFKLKKTNRDVKLHAPRARWPKADPQNPLYSGWALMEGPAEEGSTTVFVYKAGTFRHRWAKPTAAVHPSARPHSPILPPR